MTVPVSASVSIGGFNYTSTGSGFTNARLPGSICSPGTGETQFSLHNTANPSDAPWSDLVGGVLIFAYRDQIIRDAFPNEPTTGPGIDASLFYTQVGSGQFASWTFSGGLTFQEVHQPTPVPEPATLTLLGLGLAVVRRMRLQHP